MYSSWETLGKFKAQKERLGGSERVGAFGFSLWDTIGLVQWCAPALEDPGAGFTIVADLGWIPGQIKVGRRETEAHGCKQANRKAHGGSSWASGFCPLQLFL